MLVDYLFRDVSGKIEEDHLKELFFFFLTQSFVSFGQDKER